MGKVYIKLADVDNTEKGTFELNPVSTKFYKDEAVLILKIAELTETGGANSITLDVKVQSYFPEIDEWIDTAIFDQVSVTGSTKSDVQLKVMTVGLGMKQRVVYTLGGEGTVGACKFKVLAEYKEK